MIMNLRHFVCEIFIKCDVAFFDFSHYFSYFQLLQSTSALENFRVALACQVAHKNSLLVAVTLAENCARWKDAKATVSHDTERVGRVCDQTSNLSS